MKAGRAALAALLAVGCGPTAPRPDAPPVEAPISAAPAPEAEAPAETE